MKKLLLALLTLVTIQLQAQCWKEISYGGYHNIAIKNDGTLWAWGSNNVGELGDGTLENKNLPVQIGTDTDWVTISAGFKTNAAIKTNGTLWAWGLNTDGQIAGGQEYQKFPMQIGTGTNWKNVNCPGRYILAIKTDGGLWAWGNNTFGQLGLGDTENRTTPTQVGTATDWKQISAGSNFTITLKNDGTLWAFGDNFEGKLGINSSESFITSPTKIGTDNNWKMVSTKYYHTHALKNDGTLWAWGQNTYGQLGDNTTISKKAPVSISPEKIWVSLAQEVSNSLAVSSDGTLWTWGTVEFSETDGTPINTLLIPTKIGNDTDWKKVLAVGPYCNIAVKTNNTILVWGDNESGELGLGDNNAHPNQTLFGTMCDSTAGLQENTLNSISVYPNPTSGILNLANANDLNIEKLTVIDVTGKTLLEQSNTSQIDVQQLPSGMYFLEITTNGIKQHTRFIKE